MDAGGARGRGRGRRGGGGRGQRGHARTIISNNIRATLVDRVINYGPTMREAGQRVHPNLSHLTVSSIMQDGWNRVCTCKTGTVCLQLSFYYLEYLQYCTISHYLITCTVLQILYCCLCSSSTTKVVVLWNIPWLPVRIDVLYVSVQCMVYTVKYSINSTVKKKQTNDNLSLHFFIEWLEDLLGVDANACSPNSRNLPLWT